VLAEYNRTLNEEDVLVGDFTPHVARALFENYLDSCETPADVIVCANDLTAKGVLDCLKERSLKCPEDFWVTGFDDFEYAASMEPGLSTVHFPARDLGFQGAKLALQLMAGEKDAGNRVVSGFPVYRGTTANKNPKFSSYDKQLSEQWALIHQRDNNAQKLTVLRNLKRRKSLLDVIQKSSHSLADLAVDNLSFFIQDMGDDGKNFFTEIDISGVHSAEQHFKAVFPEAFSCPSEGAYWLLCPLEIEGSHYGYMVSRASPVSAEFVEFIAPQFSDLLHTEALEAKSENYRIQNELSERMASLGSLVSGVAHEVNTPIGTGKLAASALIESSNEIKKKVEKGDMTRQDFDVFMSECSEFSSIIFQSLNRAADLISSFKMVSVDQTAEAKRCFDLGDYINSVLIGLKHQLKGTKVVLNTSLAEGIVVDTYPGAVAQVVTNLFMNALKHGFDSGNNEGEINITLKKTGSGFELTTCDNGDGASEEVLTHIFDPFFTTTRGDGGSGLGMHIVFNLLSQKLYWTIQLESKPGEGFRAVIKPGQFSTLL